MKWCCLLFVFALNSVSCVAVKEYDKAYLNDEEMVLSAKSGERYETNLQIYRDGASGA
ncbi:MAG: DUF4266 domain-containing protein, partial [Bacteroidota bacterium]